MQRAGRARAASRRRVEERRGGGRSSVALEEAEEAGAVVVRLEVQPVVDRGDAADHAAAAPREEELPLGVLVERVPRRVDERARVAAQQRRPAGERAVQRVRAVRRRRREPAAVARRRDLRRRPWRPYTPRRSATGPPPRCVPTSVLGRSLESSLAFCYAAQIAVLLCESVVRRGIRRLEDVARRRAISNKVFVGNLSFDVTREELIEAFSAAGRVVDAKVPTDRETGRPRGFAFVEFESDDGARSAASSS